MQRFKNITEWTKSDQRFTYFSFFWWKSSTDTSMDWIRLKHVSLIETYQSLDYKHCLKAQGHSEYVDSMSAYHFYFHTHIHVKAFSKVPNYSEQTKHLNTLKPQDHISIRQGVTHWSSLLFSILTGTNPYQEKFSSFTGWKFTKFTFLLTNCLSMADSAEVSLVFSKVPQMLMTPCSFCLLW